ncbi:MAG: hypothetical protein IPP47_06755 [Bryobacterales bacterium]|nr:hypothetical protein [Bryobacterales bacterium]
MTNRPLALRYVARLSACCLLVGLLPALAEVQIIPQVADGGGWSTTIVLSNKTTASQPVTLRFNRGTAANDGTTEAWTPTFLEGVSLPTFNLAAGSTMFLHTPGTATAVTQGWGELDAGSGVVGYAIFTQKTASVQDGTAPAAAAANRILVPFDNTSGLVTAVAVANPNASAETIQVNIKTTDGATSTGTLPMPARGHKALVLPDLSSATTGKRGLAEFYTTSGTFSIIALRFNAGAFASAPAYPQTGQPIIGGTVTNPPASNPQVQIIPQVADGGTWSTTIVLTNTTTSNLPASLNFRLSITGSGGATGAWNLPFLENVSTSSLNIPAGSTIFLQTPGTASAVSQGYAELTASPGVNGYAIFTARTANSTQDVTAPAVSAAGRLLVPFDNDTGSGLVTPVAIVNPNANSESITVNIRADDGTTTANLQLQLPAQGHLAFVLPEQFPTTAGKRGLAEFYVSSGTIAFIALRARSSGAFTSSPAYFESGAPVITSGSGGAVAGDLSALTRHPHQPKSRAGLPEAATPRVR